MTETVTQGELVEQVKEKAVDLIGALNAAVDGGVPQAILLPELMALFRESGLSPI